MSESCRFRFLVIVPVTHTNHLISNFEYLINKSADPNHRDAGTSLPGVIILRSSVPKGSSEMHNKNALMIRLSMLLCVRIEYIYYRHCTTQLPGLDNTDQLIDKKKT